MGGYGSGRHWDKKKLTVSECRSLSLKRIFRDFGGFGWLKPGEMSTDVAYRWDTRPGKAVLTGFNREGAISLELYYTLYEGNFAGDGSFTQQIPVTATVLPKGGTRYWLKCPRCEGNTERLYLPPNHSAFSCRKCSNLTYTSSQENRSSFFRKMGREMGVDGPTIRKALDRTFGKKQRLTHGD